MSPWAVDMAYPRKGFLTDGGTASHAPAAQAALHNWPSCPGPVQDRRRPLPRPAGTRPLSSSRRRGRLDPHHVAVLAVSRGAHEGEGVEAERVLVVNGAEDGLAPGQNPDKRVHPAVADDHETRPAEIGQGGREPGHRGCTAHDNEKRAYQIDDRVDQGVHVKGSGPGIYGHSMRCWEIDVSPLLALDWRHRASSATFSPPQRDEDYEVDGGRGGETDKDEEETGVQVVALICLIYPALQKQDQPLPAMLDVQDYRSVITYP